LPITIGQRIASRYLNLNLNKALISVCITKQCQICNTKYDTGYEDGNFFLNRLNCQLQVQEIFAIKFSDNSSGYRSWFEAHSHTVPLQNST
jgi:hypothetical protein